MHDGPLAPVMRLPSAAAVCLGRSNAAKPPITSYNSLHNLRLKYRKARAMSPACAYAYTHKHG